MVTPKFKKGDTVRCIFDYPGKDKEDRAGGPGAGYEPGRIFKVHMVTNNVVNDRPIYWAQEGCGTFEDALEKYDPIKWPGNSYPIKFGKD